MLDEVIFCLLLKDQLPAHLFGRRRPLRKSERDLLISIHARHLLNQIDLPLDIATKGRGGYAQGRFILYTDIQFQILQINPDLLGRDLCPQDPIGVEDAQTDRIGPDGIRISIHHAFNDLASRQFGNQ